MAASLVAGSPWRRWLRGKSEPQCTYSEKKWENNYIFGSNWIKDDQRELPRKLISICQCNRSNQSLHNMLGRIQHGWPPRICAKMCFRSVFIADCLSDSNICQYIRKLSAAHIASYSVNQTRFIHEHFYDMKDKDSGLPVSLVLAMGSGWIWTYLDISGHSRILHHSTMLAVAGLPQFPGRRQGGVENMVSWFELLMYNYVITEYDCKTLCFTVWFWWIT